LRCAGRSDNKTSSLAAINHGEMTAPASAAAAAVVDVTDDDNDAFLE